MLSNRFALVRWGERRWGAVSNKNDNRVGNNCAETAGFGFWLMMPEENHFNLPFLGVHLAPKTASLMLVNKITDGSVLSALTLAFFFSFLLILMDSY